MTKVEHLGVCGAGIMGTGIALTAARAGLTVALYDSDPAAWERSRREQTRVVERWQARGMAPEDGAAALGRIRPATSLEEAVAGAPIVVEAIRENLAAKQDLFAQLDGLASPETILASNTSSLAPTGLASRARHPERTIGTHFMNPPYAIPLVEVTPGWHTSPETVERTVAFLEQIERTPVVLKKEMAGGISSRLLISMRNEAAHIVAEGVASAEDVDAAMRQLGFPMGPLAMLDLVGIDLHVTNCEMLNAELGTTRFQPNPLLRQMVRAGLLGRKAGRGFYDHRERLSRPAR
ncbi:MAG: 3-hydroxyacyl-CoA dehydrogenase family protein [Chloroflexi bacterium]|nr:3-hydroxyacyl-CoA dehydrogenase family protein [Chloroflexota bacterium]